MHTVTSDTESEVGSIVVDGLVEEVSFQTAFQGVSSGWKSDVKSWSISDCRSQVSKRLFTKLGGESRNAEEQLISQKESVARGVLVCWVVSSLYIRQADLKVTC